MILKDVLHIFHKELDVHYGKAEVDSFFNMLIEHYLNLKRITLLMSPGYAITKTEAQSIFEALSALKLQKPIQYIIGETEFYGLPFKVNQATLIPRPETEELVSWVLKDLQPEDGISEDLSILDIGTGSGCIAIALAKNLSSAQVYALDVSEEALNIANENALLNGVDVKFIQKDILNHQPEFRFPFEGESIPRADFKFDSIVSNPPYVRHLEKANMMPNVLDNEPHLALFVEDDAPLKFYKAICEFSLHYLKPNGTLYFEINEFLGEDMLELLKSYHFIEIELKTDIFGKQRMLKGKLSSNLKP